MSSIRLKLVTGAAILGAAVGGAAIANAASSGSTSSTSSSASTSGAASTSSASDNDKHGPHTVNGKSEAPLTGSTADSVRAAALAKVPGTIDRLETNVDGSAPYEAHIVKSDGTEVEVQVNSDFTIAAVNQMGGDHDGDGPGGP